MICGVCVEGEQHRGMGNGAQCLSSQELQDVRLIENPSTRYSGGGQVDGWPGERDDKGLFCAWCVYGRQMAI